jgi:hypothetical protein
MRAFSCPTVVRRYRLASWAGAHRSLPERKMRFVLPLAILLVICPPAVGAKKKTDNKLPPDVTIGVNTWSYERIYPLLDGLFQDVSATQVKALSLDPNAANGTNLDALQQAFQLQAQYSVTAGIQNGVAAQQASASSASTLMQAQLIGRQSQLIQSQLIAQNQVGVAQKALDSLSTNGASQSDVNAAKQQLQLANDTLASVTAQLADIKTQLSAVSSPAFSPPSANFLTTPPTLPSSLSGPANVPSTFSPNFPATKQMDNQMSLLWERLSRLVYTMNQTASGGKYHLIQIDTGIVPIKRKHEMLVTHYQLSCGKVVDIYPRSSAVNIINEKYRDSRFGLAGLAQFFSLAVNASYNRNHLQITQMLSQSSYITGFGVGTQDFGWVYGITLGEDSVSPGTRDTFVLVQSSCDDPKLSLLSAEWGKKIPPTSFEASTNTSDTANATSTQSNTGDTSSIVTWPIHDTSEEKQSDLTNPVKTISYTPLEDDLTSTTSTAVMVAITLQDKVNIDPETTITADGILVSRIRDTFGRAVVGGGGSGGVLEVTATQLQLNTWIPVNSHELILNMNPRTFRGHFPTVLLQSPRGAIELQTKEADIWIQGRRCDDCRKALPPLSYPKSAIANLSVARWLFWSTDPLHPGTGSVHYDTNDAKIVINAIVSSGSTLGQASNSPTPLQVIGDADSNPWGSSPQVQIVRQPDDGSVFRLDCRAVGPQLVCSSPRMRKTKEDAEPKCSLKAPCLYTDAAYQVDVIDADHSGGAFHGRGVLGPCGQELGLLCSQPLIWKMDPPVWTAAGSAAPADAAVLRGTNGWVFHVSMINISEGERAQFNHQSMCQGTNNLACSDLNQTFDCAGDGKICRVTFVFRKESLTSYRDSMDLQVYPEHPLTFNATIGVIKIGGLRSQMNPILGSISSDSTQLAGNNLVFDQLVVGAGGKPISMICSAPSDCNITYPSTTKKGYLYFVARPDQGEGGLVPVMLQNAQGMAKVLYTPPEKPSPPATGTQPQAMQPVQPTVPLSSRIE